MTANGLVQHVDGRWGLVAFMPHQGLLVVRPLRGQGLERWATSDTVASSVPKQRPR